MCLHRAGETATVMNIRVAGITKKAIPAKAMTEIIMMMTMTVKIHAMTMIHIVHTIVTRMMMRTGIVTMTGM
jgi:hypothetical protein